VFAASDLQSLPARCVQIELGLRVCRHIVALIKRADLAKPSPTPLALAPAFFARVLGVAPALADLSSGIKTFSLLWIIDI
jgi:hypothetical protein